MLGLLTALFLLTSPLESQATDGGFSSEPPGAASTNGKLSSPLEAEDDEEAISSGADEMEELRNLEAAEVVATPPGQANLGAALGWMGYAHPLRHHLEYALEDFGPSSTASLVPPFALFTDVAGFDINQVKAKFDIPVEMHPLVQQYMHFFLGKGRQWFSKWMSRSSRYIPMFQPILQQYGLPKDTVFLAMIESGFSPHAYSWAHASGPWQFISSTGKMYQLHQDFWIDQRRDPIKSTHAAARYLMHLYQELGSWHLAWAAYNSGSGRVRRVINKKGTTNFWALVEGRGLPKETKHYVPKMIAAALIAKHYREFGFKDEEFDYLEPLSFEEVPIDAAVDLDVLAKLAGITAEEVRELNPELKRWCTPPTSDGASYLLRVPLGKGAQFREEYSKLDAAQKLNFVVHKIQRGDTLSKIAAKYKSRPEIVMRLNGLADPKTLKLGTELAIPVSAAGIDLESQAQQARKAGFVAPRAEEEVPAGLRVKTAQGTVKKENFNGKTKITYGVASGDSLWLIGQRFGCTVEDLRKWNGLSRRTKLQIGMPLIIWNQSKTAPLTKNNSGRHRTGR